MKAKLVFSRFFHEYKKNNSVICYNALTMEKFEVSCEEMHAIKAYMNGSTNDIDEDKLRRFIEEGMIVPENSDEQVLNDLRSKIFNGVGIRVMVLHMTDYCNLRCKYCFIEGGQPENYKRKMMNEDVAKVAVDKFINILKRQGNEGNSPTVVFYGGEPLFNWSVIKSTLEYLVKIEEEVGFKIDKVIITNGTLITEEIAKVIKEYNVMVSVSMDGIKSVHDANRITVDGKESFDKVVCGMEVLKENGVEPAVSCVMAKEGIEYCEESVKFLVEKMNITGLGFNHVSIIPGLNCYDAEYEEKFADAIIRVQELIQNNYPNVYERRMGHKVNTFIDKKLIKSDCTGCGEQMSISPDGEIGICQGYMGSRKTFAHTVYEHEYFPDEDPVFVEWSNRSPLNIEECTYCPALATCGGGCPRNADMLHGTIWSVDTAFCHFAKKAQEWLINQEIEE